VGSDACIGDWESNGGISGASWEHAAAINAMRSVEDTVTVSCKRLNDKSMNVIKNTASVCRLNDAAS